MDSWSSPVILIGSRAALLPSTSVQTASSDPNQAPEPSVSALT